MLRLDGECIRGVIDAKYGGSISRLAAALSLEPPPDSKHGDAVALVRR